jgi:chromosome segregation ATPase
MPEGQRAIASDPASASEILQRLETEIRSASAKVESLEANEKEALAAYEAEREAWLQAQADRTAIRAELDTAEAAMVDAKKKHDEASAALAAAQKKLAENRTRAILLDDSAAKLEQALSLAGAEDAELSQAIAVAKQRAEAARGQDAGIEKTVADAQTAVTAAEPALQQATAKVDDVVHRLQPIQAALLAADEKQVAARRSWFEAHSNVVATRKSLARSERLVQWLAEIDKSHQLAQRMEATEAKLAASRADEADLLSKMEAAKETVAMAEQRLQAAETQLAKASQTMKQRQQEIRTLQQSLDSLGDATKLVSKTESLKAAQGVLREEITAKQTQIGQFLADVDAAQAEVNSNSDGLNRQRGELETRMASHQQLLEQRKQIEKQLSDLGTQLQAAKSTVQSHHEKIASDSETELALTRLTPLTAEQLCWSTLRVTGVLDAYIRTELAELEKQSPLPADADEAAKAERQRQAMRQAIEKLRGIADHYVSLYASGPDKTQDDFFASADQALYVANGGSVFGWAGPGNNNPTQVATSLTDPTDVANVLYWSYLCRQPTSDEIALVTDQLASAGDQRNAVIHEMAWSLLASAEFRFAR